MADSIKDVVLKLMLETEKSKGLDSVNKQLDKTIEKVKEAKKEVQSMDKAVRPLTKKQAELEKIKAGNIRKASQPRTKEETAKWDKIKKKDEEWNEFLEENAKSLARAKEHLENYRKSLTKTTEATGRFAKIQDAIIGKLLKYTNILNKANVVKEAWLRGMISGRTAVMMLLKAFGPLLGLVGAVAGAFALFHDMLRPKNIERTFGFLEKGTGILGLLGKALKFVLLPLKWFYEGLKLVYEITKKAIKVVRDFVMVMSDLEATEKKAGELQLKLAKIANDRADAAERSAEVELRMTEILEMENEKVKENLALNDARIKQDKAGELNVLREAQKREAVFSKSKREGLQGMLANVQGSYTDPNLKATYAEVDNLEKAKQLAEDLVKSTESRMKRQEKINALHVSNLRTTQALLESEKDRTRSVRDRIKAEEDRQKAERERRRGLDEVIGRLRPTQRRRLEGLQDRYASGERTEKLAKGIERILGGHAKEVVGGIYSQLGAGGGEQFAQLLKDSKAEERFAEGTRKFEEEVEKIAKGDEKFLEKMKNLTGLTEDELSLEIEQVGKMEFIKAKQIEVNKQLSDALGGHGTALVAMAKELHEQNLELLEIRTAIENMKNTPK